MAPKPDWNFLGGFSDKPSLEDDEADEVLEELRDVDADSIAEEKHLRLAFNLAKIVMMVKAEQAEVALEELENMAKDEGKVGAKRERQLEAKIRDLEDELARGGGGGRGGLDSRGRDLQKRCAMLEADVKDLEAELNAEKRMMTELEEKLEAAEKKAKSFKRENEALQADMKELLAQMESSTTQDSLDNNSKEKLEAEFAVKMSAKNKQLLEALEENKNLADANRDLRDEMETLRTQLKDATEKMDAMADQFGEIGARVENNERRREAIEAERERLEGDNEELKRQLAAKSDVDDQIMIAVEEKVGEWRKLAQRKDGEIQRLQLRVEELGKTSFAAVDEVAAVASLSKAVADRDVEIEGLKERLKDATSDMMSSTLILEDVKKGNVGSQKLLQRQAQRAKGLEKKAEEKEEELKGLRRRLEETEADARTKDAELNDVTSRLHKFQMGQYGLPDAIKEIKDCKKKLTAQDQRIEDLVKEANQREATLSDLDAENEHLRSRVGISADAPIDLTKFRLDKLRKKQEEIAINAVLKAEIESLEEERVALKNQIRLLAQRLGGKAAALGLQSDDLEAIDKFTEELKAKKSGGPSSMVSTTNAKTIFADDGAGWAASRIERERYDRDMKALGVKLAAVEAEKKEAENRWRESEEENANLVLALREMKSAIDSRKSRDETADVDEPLACPSLDRILAVYDAKRQLEKKNEPTLLLKAMADKAEGKVEELRRELKEAKRDSTRAVREKDELEARLKRMEGEMKRQSLVAATEDISSSQLQQPPRLGEKPLPYPHRSLPESMPQSSSEIIHALNEELLQSLVEIESKDKTIESLEARAESFIRRVGVAKQKLHLLYKQAAEKTQSLDEKEKAIDDKLRAFEADRETEAARLAEFDRLLDTLERDEEEVKRRLGDLTRKVSVFRVNEKVLARRYSLVSEWEGDLRKELDQCRKELMETRGAIVAKVGATRRRQETAEFKVAALQRALAVSVPTEEMERLQKDYNDVVAKYRDALEKESTMREEDDRGKRLEEENKTLREGLEDMRKEVEIEKSKRTALEAYMEEARGRGGGDSLPSAMTTSVRDSQLKTLSERLTIMEMKELNERQRANHADRMYVRLKDALKSTEGRNSQLEENFGNLSRMNLQLQNAETKMRDELLKSVPMAELEGAKNEKNELEKIVNQLRQRANYYKESSDIALSQIEQINFFEACREKERESFTLQLVELQARSDDATKFGHLHRQIVTLSASEGAAKITLKDAERKIGALTARLAAAEQRADDSVNAAYHIRQETTTHIRQLKSAIFHLRKQYSGCVTLKQQEKYHKLVKETQERKKRVEDQLETLKMDDEKLKDDLEAAAAKNETLTELLKAMKCGGGAVDEDAPSVAFDAWEHPLKLWQSKVEEMRRKEMKSSRLISSHREELDHVKDIVVKRESAIEDLEAENLKLIQSQEEQQLFWDAREAQLEATLKKFETRQKEIVSVARKFNDVSAAGGRASATGVPDASLPVGEQLDLAVQTIKTQLKEVVEGRQKISALEDVVAGKKSEIRSLEKKLTTREKVIAELRRFIPAEVDVDPILKEAGQQRHQPEEQPAMDRETLDGALHVAKMKIESLQSEVKSKEESIAKLEAMLQASKDNHDSINAAHRQEIDQLLAKVISVQSIGVERVKEDVRKSGELIGGKNAELEKRLARMTELETLVLEQDLALANMATKVRKSKMETDKVVATLEEKVKKGEETARGLKEELRKTTEIKDLAEAALEEAKKNHEASESKVASLRDAEEHLNAVLEENENLKREAARAPSKHAKALIERLKNDLALKESQQKALSKALTELRADMVDSAEERVLANEARRGDESNVKTIVDKAVVEAKKETRAEVEELKKELETERRRVEEARAAGETTARSRTVNEDTRNEEITERDVEISKLKIRNDQLIEQKLKAKGDHERETNDLKRKLKLLEDKLATTVPAEKPFVTDPATEERKQKAHLAYQQWEGKKQQQAQIDKLKSKLREKEGQCIRLESKVATQNTLLQRADKEKLALENKLKNSEIAKTRALVAAASALPATEEERNLHELRSKNYQLAEQIEQLKAGLNDSEQKDVAIEELRRRNEELRHRLDYLMKTGKDVADEEEGPGAGKTVLDFDNYERVLVVQEALQRETELQEEVLKANKENLELKFEIEQHKQAPVRLRERITDLEEYVEALKEEILQLQLKLTAAGEREIAGIQKDPPNSARSSTAGSGIRRIGESGRSNVELEKTVLALKKVIEKLENENKTLKKSPSVVSQQKLVHLSKENQGLKKSMEELRLKVGASLSERYEASQRGKEKIQSENQRLGVELGAATEDREKTKTALASAKRDILHLETQLEETKRRLEEEKARVSTADSAGKSGAGGWKSGVVARMYEQKLKELEESLTKKEEKMRGIAQENEALKKELGNFDPSFFEEIEDLKYNYKRSVERNVQLEEILAKLVTKYNIPLDLSAVG